MLTYNDGRLGAPYAQVSATNTGHRVVTVTTLAFEFPGGGRLIPTSWDNLYGVPDSKLPMKLADGESASLSMSYLDVGTTLLERGFRGTVKLIPVCDDSAGNTHKGEPWSINPQEFVDMSR
jgi:hypothetical protein